MECDELGTLLREAADGDRRSLEEFVSLTQGDVWRLCRALLPSAVADDATQEVYLRVWRSARSFRGESSTRTWLYTITRRTCYEMMRRQRRHPVPVADRQEGSVEDPSRSLVLQALVDRLDPDRRTAFVLTQLHGLSYQEAAEACGCRIGTIRSRVARARSQLIEEAASTAAERARPPV